MGLILDTGLFVRAERQGLSVTSALDLWSTRFADAELGLSVITLTELAHGIPRAESAQRRAERIEFIAGLRSAIPIYEVSPDIAFSAGILDGELRQAGITIGMADLLIAATALTRGDGVATFNIRHFREIAGLDVVEL